MISRRTFLKSAAVTAVMASQASCGLGKPQTLWQANLAGVPLGPTTAETIRTILGPTFATAESLILNSEVITGEALRQHIPAGTLGSLTATPILPQRVDDATISFDVRFDPEFVWQHGLKFGAGLVGVKPGAGIYEPTSGRSRDLGCSVRLMVHGNYGGERPFQGQLGPLKPGTDNEVVTYLYARHPSDGFGGFGWHTGLGSFTRGDWHRVKMRAKLNTPRRRNGVFEVWIDDDLRWNSNSMDYRGSDASIRWDAVLWDTHRGGGPQENWLSPRDDYLDMRNITVTH